MTTKTNNKIILDSVVIKKVIILYCEDCSTTDEDKYECYKKGARYYCITCDKRMKEKLVEETNRDRPKR